MLRMNGDRFTKITPEMGSWGKLKVKLNLSLCLTKHHVMKMYFLLNKASRHEDVLGSGGIAVLILILGTRWR